MKLAAFCKRTLCIEAIKWTSGRDKREAAKRLGHRAASSSDDDSDGAANRTAGAADPFIQQDADEDPFADPFFQVQYFKAVLDVQ